MLTQVAWELAKVVDTLKACGHMVTLILKVGPHHYQNGCSKEEEADEGEVMVDREEEREQEEEEKDEVEGKREDEEEEEECGGDNDETFVSHDSSRDSSCDSQPQQYQLSDHSATNELEDSKSPRTPESFEGDTDFSGMQPLDLKRTSSAPLTDKEKASAFEASTESTGDSLNAASSCEEVDGSPVIKREDMSFEQRLENRTSSDGRLRQSVAVS